MFILPLTSDHLSGATALTCGRSRQVSLYYTWAHAVWYYTLQLHKYLATLNHWLPDLFAFMCSYSAHSNCAWETVQCQSTVYSTDLSSYMGCSERYFPMHYYVFSYCSKPFLCIFILRNLLGLPLWWTAQSKSLLCTVHFNMYLYNDPTPLLFASQWNKYGLMQ